MKEVIILSVDKRTLSKRDNNANHKLALRILKRAGMAAQSVKGRHKGVKERSIIVAVDSVSDCEYVRALADDFLQDSVLFVCQHRGVYELTQTHVAWLGKLRAVSKGVAKTHESYTKANGCYYVVN
jgi:hypothetical protein